ncbi:hypothetical protein [uncultured Brevundimonas sp.]|uniref:hypothetical protein n=1 Tax=uncultured Brevundimonas sp. TaxID=213418 RepID=UPI0025CF1412|nr:hypothetical protein [uncultured Brevundimonas sp.]
MAHLIEDRQGLYRFIRRHSVIGMATFLAPVIGAWTGMRIAAQAGDPTKSVARLHHYRRLLTSPREGVLANAIDDGQTLDQAVDGVQPPSELVHDFQKYMRERDHAA